MKYVIKKCAVKEIISILTLFDPYSDRPFSFRDDEKKNNWPNKLATYANTIICYNENDDVVGCLFFYDNDLAKQNKEGFCVFFCVLPEYRRCGIASEMINRVKNHLNSEGIPYFKLKCAKSNEPAFKLYQKNGFHVVDDDGRAYAMITKTDN